MRDKIEFLGLNYANLAMDELIAEIDRHILEKRKCRIYTPNVALLVWSRNDPFLKEVYNSCEILTVDGHAIYYAMMILREPIKATLSPSVFYHPLLEMLQDKGHKLYLVGAKEHVVKKNVEVLRKEYPDLKIVGFHNGYFDVDNPPAGLIDDIRNQHAEILFVGMTTPMKERFIESNIDKMGVSVCIGVGGMFDIIAGEAKYAPKWIRVLALEWFYRLVQEPRRLWKRYLTTNTVFILLFVKEFLLRCLGKSGKNR